MTASLPFSDPAFAPALPPGAECRAGLCHGSTGVVVAVAAEAPDRGRLIVWQRDEGRWAPIPLPEPASTALAGLDDPLAVLVALEPDAAGDGVCLVAALGAHLVHICADGTSERQDLPQPIQALAADAKGGVIAGGAAGLIHSRDGGRSWQPAGPVPATGRLTRLALFAGRLCAVTEAGPAGFSLWTTPWGPDTAPPDPVPDPVPDPDPVPARAWDLIAERGAARYRLNESVASLVSFGDMLILGTSARTSPGIPGLAAPPELVCLLADGTWDLVMGDPRFSPAGLRVPLAAWPAGFGEARDAAVAGLAVVSGRLCALLAPLPGETGPAALWISPDGEDWQPLPAPGLEALAAARCLIATPDGLMIGGRPADPTGPCLVRLAVG